MTHLNYHRCVDGVTEIAKRSCPEQLQKLRHENFTLSDDDQTRLKAVIWDLILERVLVPGTENPRSSADGWPFLTLTEHGKKAVQETSPTAYDPDRYLASLPLIATTVKAYLAEAIGTFRTGNHLSASVMIGAASEMLFLELCEAFKIALANPKEQSEFEKATTKQRFIKDTIAGFVKWLKNKKDQLPDKWKRAEQIHLVDSVGEFIRSRRNEAGHPQDPPVVRSHEEAFALLQLFRRNCEDFCELKQYLLNHPNSI